MRHIRRSTLIWMAGMLLPGIGLGLLLSVVLANHIGSGEVRIVAQRQADGDVEVALQQREAGGDWGERLLAANRFVPANAEPGDWLHSSVLNIGAGLFLDGDLVCLIDHGTPGDLQFWRLAHISAQEAASDFRMNLRVESGATPAAQAELINKCVADGAAVIGTTLAAPDVVGPAIVAAREAGVQIATFNSGASEAAGYGSAIHVGLDDPATGDMAGRAFADAGLTGTLICVIHEAANVGLEKRCDHVETAYSGTVERLRVDQAGLSNLDQVETMITDRLAEGDVVAVLTLNSALVKPAQAAIEDSGHDIELGTVGWVMTFIPQILEGDLLFSILDLPELQGYLAVSAIGILGFHETIGIDASLVLGGSKVLMDPLLYDRKRVATLADQLEALLDWAADANDWTLLEDMNGHGHSHGEE